MEDGHHASATFAIYILCMPLNRKFLVREAQKHLPLHSYLLQEFKMVRTKTAKLASKERRETEQKP